VSREDLESALKEIEGNHSREVGELIKKERVDPRSLRNMAAHGGLGYVTLKEIVVRDGRVVKIVYDGKLLRRVLGEVIGDGEEDR